MGTCEYVLAKGSVNNTFEVRQVNEPCENGPQSCTKSLTVIFPRVTIQLTRGSVVVGGTDVDLPALFDGESKKIKYFLKSYILDGECIFKSMIPTKCSPIPICYKFNILIFPFTYVILRNMKKIEMVVGKFANFLKVMINNLQFHSIPPANLLMLLLANFKT